MENHASENKALKHDDILALDVATHCGYFSKHEVINLFFLVCLSRPYRLLFSKPFSDLCYLLHHSNISMNFPVPLKQDCKNTSFFLRSAPQQKLFFTFLKSHSLTTLYHQPMPPLLPLFFPLLALFSQKNTHTLSLFGNFSEHFPFSEYKIRR